MSTTPKRNEPVAVFEHAAEALPEGAEPTPRPEWALSDERIPLFAYDDENGERVSVTMPAKPNPGLGLEFLRKGRTIGAELAISWLIEEAIGAEGYDALVRELSDMPDPENGTNVLRDVGQRVQLVVMGGLDGPKA